MKAIKVKVGIKDVEVALHQFVGTGERLMRGDKVKTERGVYFTSLEAFRKVLTPRRLELLRVIRSEKPESINQLAKLVGRDIKNVADDVKYLGQVGLITTEGTKKQVSPRVDYETIVLEIAV